MALTSLPDLNGYQLSSLIKSNDRTSKLPVVLIQGESVEQEEFWKLAAQADAFYSADDIKEPEKVVEAVQKLVEEARAQGWKPSLVKNLLIPSRSFSSANLIASYGGLLDNLLIQRMVIRACRNLTALVEPRKQFAEAYFAVISQLFHPDLLGIALANHENSWAAYQVMDGLSAESFEQLSAKIIKQLATNKDIDVDVIGKLEDGGKAIAEYENPASTQRQGAGSADFRLLAEEVVQRHGARFHDSIASAHATGRAALTGQARNRSPAGARGLPRLHRSADGTVQSGVSGGLPAAAIAFLLQAAPGSRHGDSGHRQFCSDQR